MSTSIETSVIENGPYEGSFNDSIGVTKEQSNIIANACKTVLDEMTLEGEFSSSEYVIRVLGIVPNCGPGDGIIVGMNLSNIIITMQEQKIMREFLNKLNGFI
jgi:hypothetical protein